jgi:Superfamily II DNA/RNA helicases, SNF2 family
MSADARVVLDARLDDGQLWIVTEPDDHLKKPPAELAPVLGRRARSMFKSFWVAPTGFERRWTVAVDEVAAFRAILETGWPVTPALGTLLELFVATARIVHEGDVIPGPVPNVATGWVAAPDRTGAARLRATVDSAVEVHPEAEEFRDLLVHSLALEVLGSVPPALDGRAPTPTMKLWTDRVSARRAAGARLVLRLDDTAEGFVVVPCLQARRTTAVIFALDLDEPGSLDAAAAALDTPIETITVVVEREWDAAGRAWQGIRDRRLGPINLEIKDVIELIERAAPRLDTAGINVLLPAGLGRKRSATRRLHVQGQAAGLDVASLVLTGDVQIDGTPLSAAELAAIVRSPMDLVSVGGRWTFLADGERARIAAFVRTLGDADPVAVLEAAAAAEADHDTTVEIEIDPTSWLARAMRGAWQPAPAEHVALPEQVKVPLRHYQRDGLDWLVWLERNELGGILADDMGLGKTAMLLALVAHDHEGPTLVVAPTSVVGNWEREAARFTPDLRVTVHHGGGRGDPKGTAANADIILTSYGVMRRDTRLSEIAWHRVILDEAQAIKNALTATAKTARALTARHHIAATGTPVENDLDELWSIMTFANPGLLGSRTGFAEKYRLTADGIENTARLAHLRARVAAFICRRTKTEPGIVDELPERIIVRDDCMLTSEQVALYEATAAAMLNEVADAADDKRRRLHVFSGIAKLKQICNHPASLVEGDTSDLSGRSGKLERLIELTREIVAEDEAVVVFSQYATFLRRLAPHLAHALDVPVPILHGGVSRPRRDKIVEQFSAERGGGVLAVSLRAGGTGLNLVRANHVIHFDRWWNPAVEDQASDRVWRIGQTRGVVVHTLVCPGTIEERIASIIDAKRALAGSVITSTETLITSLDNRELEAFVALDIAEATGK